MKRQHTGALGLCVVVLLLRLMLTTANPDVFQFDDMAKLIKRLDVLETTALDSLLGFYEPNLHTFCAKAEDLGRKNRVCITSSCYSLLTLTLANSGNNAYDHLASLGDDAAIIGEEEYMALGYEADGTGNTEEKAATEDTNYDASSTRHSPQSGIVAIHQVLESILDSPWREDDLFQAPLLLYTVLKVDQEGSLVRRHAAKLGKLVKRILEARPHRHYGLQQEHSDYVIYQICKCVALLQESLHSATPGLPSSVLPENVTSEAFWALLRCAEGAFSC